MVEINRETRARIAAAVGPEVVDEIKRYNDRAVDSLADYGVDLDPREELIQQQTLELLAAGEEVDTDG